MKYKELRPELKTGDIVLFAGHGTYSWAISKATNSKWTHVGMIYRHRTTDVVYLWESVISCGVRRIALFDRISHYNGQIAVRCLSIPLSDQHLMEAFRRHRGKSYEDNPFELARAAYNGVGGQNTPHPETLFCSELIGETYQIGEKLCKGIITNELVPADFSSDRGDKILCNGQELSSEIFINL